MAKKEAEFTAQLCASLRAAGCLGVHKIADPPIYQGMKTRFNAKRPCDVVAILPGGRGLRVEVKQQQANKHHETMGFNPSKLAPHQSEHLAEVSEAGGCAVVALVSWSARVHWRLYLWEWPRFMWLTDNGKRAISAADMRVLPCIERTTAAKGWPLAGKVREWCAPRTDKALAGREVLSAAIVGAS